MYPEDPFMVKTVSTDILEIPVTIRYLRILPHVSGIHSFFSGIKKLITGKAVRLRPNGNNLHDMLALIDTTKTSNADYLMFMLHSSELMPGGSPAFKTLKSIENLYDDLEIIFNKIAGDFRGITLKGYYESAVRVSGSL
jgi:hypothetical protein